MRLPLTLALGRALVARVGGQSFALPVSCVRESAEVCATSIECDGAREVWRLRDESLPVVRLRDVLGARGEAPGVAVRDAAASNDERAASPVLEAAIIEAGGRRAALLVDAIDGQQELLVRPLPPLRGALRIFGGATILVDGTPALVLDVPSLVPPAHAAVHRTLA
jgi:two-component system chemotaxis sensor kinase CheA